MLGHHNAEVGLAIFTIGALATLLALAASGRWGSYVALIGGTALAGSSVVLIFAIRWSQFASDAAAHGHVGTGPFAMLAGGATLAAGGVINLWRNSDRGLAQIFTDPNLNNRTAAQPITG
jgi:hypothetical protein